MKKRVLLILLALTLTAAAVFTGCESLGGLFGGGDKDSGKSGSKDDKKAEKEVDDRDTSWYKSGESTFYIANDKQLGGMAKLTNLAKNPVDFEGKTIVLTADIDLAGTKWRPTGAFKGTFDGKGFSISNLSVSGYNKAALFGDVEMGQIKNLVLYVDKIESKNNAVSNAGGLIGTGLGVTIENCAVIIKDSITANVEKSNLAYAGGLAGSLDGIPMFPSNINNCYVSGNVSAVASNGNGSASAGGLVGFVGLSLMRAVVNVNNSYVVGNISATSADSNAFAGGLIASGGIFETNIKNSYVSAVVTSTVENDRGGRNTAFVGGFFGRWSSGVNTAAYYNSTKVPSQNMNSGARDSTSLPTGLTPLSDADMKKQASFKDFDFNSVWAIDAGTNNGYPYLRWQKK
jgi:hypothetical protein